MRSVSLYACTKSCLCISILLTLSLPASAASVVVAGDNGISGADGTVTFPYGSNGTTALSTSATADSVDNYNSATVTGGVGGAGGKAADTGTGGAGGNGGDAFSMANTAAPTGDVTSWSTAWWHWGRRRGVARYARNRRQRR
jgi:hypothetical protein